LFGHEKGAFTGAVQRRLGRFELAEGGTIFLDEVGDLPTETQIALLRVLQEREFERVGGTEMLRCDVRVIAATNRDLHSAIAAGSFRSDLYYRLNVLPIRLPALREHADDVPALVNFFLDSFNAEFKKRVSGVSPAAAARLKGYGWPGNVRELRNVVERAMLLAEGPQLQAHDFGALKGGAASGDPFDLPAAGVDLEELERSLVTQALKRSGGNQTKAAALLGLNRDQIRYRVEKFGLSVTPS
jgi:two-component system response regulator AtoC